MKKNNNKEKKEKKIRKLLLLISDKEMQKKIKGKNPVLINSMTPLELENSFQLYKDIINLSGSTYTNILEKHIVEHVVDIHKNIDYYYSDCIDKKHRKKNNRKYKRVYSTKYFGSNFADFFDDDEEESEEKEEDENEEIIKKIIPFIKKKKNVGEGKINKDKSYSIISPRDNYINKENINNNICIDTCDFNSNNQQRSEKQKNQQNMLDINNKLIYYCYTNLKRKRPLYIPKDGDDEEICGLEIEEYFNQMKLRSSTVKKNKVKNKMQINKTNTIRSKSTKNLNRKKVKKNKYSKDLKDMNKKNNIRRCDTIRHNNNNNLNVITNELSDLKSKIKKFKSIKSEKKSKIKKERLSQENKILKCSTISMVKRHNKILSNDSKIMIFKEFPYENIISKKPTKTTFHEESSPFFENKKKNNSKKKEIKSNNKSKETKSNSKNKDIKTSSKSKETKTSSKNKDIKTSSKKKETKTNSKNKEKVKDSKKNIKSKFKYIANSKLKHQCLEEIKIGSNKPNKKSLKEPIRPQFMNTLQKKVGFIFEENKKNLYRNENSSSKTSLISKKKSKSKKDCIEYDDNSDDDDDEQYYKKRKLSYGLKDKNINSIHSKKNNSIHKKRKFS